MPGVRPPPQQSRGSVGSGRGWNGPLPTRSRDHCRWRVRRPGSTGSRFRRSLDRWIRDNRGAVERLRRSETPYDVAVFNYEPELSGAETFANVDEHHGGRSCNPPYRRLVVLVFTR
jgi:hypothetical protein